MIDLGIDKNIFLKLSDFLIRSKCDYNSFVYRLARIFTASLVESLYTKVYKPPKPGSAILYKAVIISNLHI